MVKNGQISTRGLKANDKIYNELVFDVNSLYFKENSGYEVVHQTTKINGKKVQEIDIYYRGVGIIYFPINLDDIEITIEKILNKKTA